MKKVVLSLISIFMLVGCSLSGSPSSKVEAYLNKYNSLSDDVKLDMETTIASENLSTENQKIYTDVLARQYQNLKYEIKDEVVDAEDATVNVKITVYDLHKVETTSLQYLNEHNNEFYENNVFNEENYTKYKLNAMLKASDTVDYEIIFYLKKENGDWVIQNLDRVTLEKIHGLYNYENQ